MSGCWGQSQVGGSPSEDPIAACGLVPEDEGVSFSVLTVAQMRSWETATWSAGIRAEDVIAQVGRKLGEWLLAQSGADDHLIFLAGRGHNGDDTRAASQWIGSRRSQGLLNIDDPDAESARVSAALEEPPAGGARVWLVDGLFGIGLNRELSAGWCALIERINQRSEARRIRVVAVDVPSGLMDDEGGSAGAMIVADHTLTVGAPKRGLVGLSAAGRVEVLGDVGLLAGGGRPLGSPVSDGDGSGLEWLEPEDFRYFQPGRPVDAHKGSLGHLLIIAGSVGFHGAAVLAARAALRAGPGLVSVVTDPAAYLPVAVQLAQPMVFPWTLGIAAPESVTAVVMGPGLASRDVPVGLRQWVDSLWRSFPGPVLADASALDWVREGGAAGPRIITPHPGEAARMLRTKADVIQADRVGAVRKLRERFGGLAVLKGFHTLISSDKTTWVNPSGNPGLAQGGSGDVLAGFVGGWLARRVPIERAVAYGVWEHGAAADRLTTRQGRDRAWGVQELIEELQ